MRTQPIPFIVLAPLPAKAAAVAVRHDDGREVVIVSENETERFRGVARIAVRTRRKLGIAAYTLLVSDLPPAA